MTHPSTADPSATGARSAQGPPVPGLFTPYELGSLELMHRGWVSPMCQYSADPETAPGVPREWHLVHLGSFAVGGAALILTESTAVSPEGRISSRDTGIWNDEQVQAWRRIVDFVHEYGAASTKIGMQLGHAGRKASTYWPFHDKQGSEPASENGWQALSPGTEPFDGYDAPRAMDEDDIRKVIRDFGDAAARVVDTGFDTLEIHGAHGYLLHQFQSPLVNRRTDGWGGDEERRNRLTLDVIEEIRRRVPPSFPVILRMSTTDWMAGGIDGDSSVRLARAAKERGVDLIDASTGGAVADAKIPVGPGYQTELAARIRREAGIAVGAVGLITDAHQADHIIRTGQADGVFIARAALRDPHWWQRAAFELRAQVGWTAQYERAIPRGKF